MKTMERRQFLGSLAAALGTAAAAKTNAAEPTPAAPAAAAGASRRPTLGAPICVGSANALRTFARASEVIAGGGRPLDAVVEAVALVEDDPSDHSVGLGGIPNEEGVVELDASVMDGATMRAGAVAALHNIQNPARVAKLVCERTTRVLLVGPGALDFARANGLKEVDLLTEEARKIWLYWKSRRNDRDDWIPGPRDLEDPVIRNFYDAYKGNYWPQGTIHVSMLAPDGNLAGCTSTSGLYFKIPGRVGDSPIVGAGLYVDRGVGAAGSTGWGEGNLQTLGSHTVVEAMRRGKKPEAACLEAAERVVELLIGARRNERDAPDRWNLSYYALNLDGEVGGASIWKGGHYAVLSGAGSELRPLAYLYPRS